MRLLQQRPIRVVLRWQGIVTVALTAIAWLGSGGHGGLSAALGGLIGIVAALAFAAVASLGGASDAGTAPLAVLRAEAVKVALIVVLLWLVLTTYKEVAIVWFIGSFLASVLILVIAPAVRDR
ncbi:MAG: ATP synthase subunit I [Pseudomonadota bacterium]